MPSTRCFFSVPWLLILPLSSGISDCSKCFVFHHFFNCVYCYCVYLLLIFLSFCSGGSLVVVVCSFKCLRSAFCDSSRHYLVLIFMTLFFTYDFSGFKEPFLINFFIFSIFFSKVSKYNFQLKFCCDIVKTPF